MSAALTNPAVLVEAAALDGASNSLDRSGDRRWVTLAVLCVSLLIIVVDNTIVNVTLPSLVRQLGASVSQLQWVVDAYTVIFAGLLLLAGTLGDRWGRRRALIVGLIVFAATSGAAAFAGGVGQLVTARAVMGGAAAFIMPATADRVPTVYVENRHVVGLDPADPIRVDYEKPIGDWPTGRARPDLLSMPASHGHDQTIVNGIGRIGYMTGGRAALWKDEDMALTFTSRATAFIERHKEQPFFLYFAPHDPHVPRVPNQRFAGCTALLEWRQKFRRRSPAIQPSCWASDFSAI